MQLQMLKKTSLIILVVLIVIGIGAAASYADTVVTTERAATSNPYFHSGTSFLGTVFYFVGDVVALPFRLIGTLFDSIL